MLKGRSIICFAHDWAGDPTSKTHIMRILSMWNRVLWVNSIGMRRPSASRRDLRRLLAKLRRGLAGCQRVNEHFYVYDPIVLPFPGVAGVDRFNAAILSASIRRLARRLELERPLLWSFLPNVSGLVGRLRESAVIYHCVDEYSAFSGVPRAALQRMERELVTRADIVFASSEQLCAERRPYNPSTFFVSHGVDVEHFATALDPRTPVPEDARGLPSPVVGFFGLIADWVDIPLVRDLALARPDSSVVLIGKATTDLSPVTALPNVHLLGQKPYATLPRYCKAFDVGIIPFRISELTLKANPLKLREYLAAGLPVVATNLPEIRRYQGLVTVASSPQAFVREIELALGESDPAASLRRVEAMRGESWEARVEELSSRIEALPVGGGR